MKPYHWIQYGILVLPGLASGAGYYLPNQDAFATARGNAFVATADSSAAVHYNPAGLTQLERPEAEVGVYSIVLGNDATVAGVETSAKEEFQAAPHIYAARPINDRWSFGLGVNSPFGLGTDWGRGTNFSPVVTEARLMYLSTTAAVGYQVNDQLSIGASVSGNYADLALEQGLGVPGSYLRFDGQDLGASASVGLLWRPAEKHSFGLVYSTESTFDLDGKTTSNGLLADLNSDLDFMAPARAAIGYSYRPKPGWNIEANIEWLNWDQLNTLALQTNSVPGTTVVPIPFEWESSFIYEVGASYKTESGYIFAAGYDFNESAQPDLHFTPGVSDADRHWLNVGFGRDCENFSWMLTYQFGFSDRTVDGAAVPLANGKYEARHNALVFSWKTEF